MFTDIDGVPRGKTINASKLKSATERGLGWCNVVFGWDSADAPYDNTQASGWHTGYPDARLRVDMSTLRRQPWHEGMPLVIGDFEGGLLSDVCPRSLLKRVLAKAEGMGYVVQAAIEYEWFLFAETPISLAAKQGLPPQPATPGMHGYSVLRPASLADFNRDLWQNCAEFGVPLEGLHTETGPGVYEAAPVYTEALAAADRAACLKLAVKQTALQHDMIASFMAKWRADLPGCGGHLHQSLADAKRGENLFATEGASANGMSPLFESYVAGQLRSLPTLMPILAPNVNSYKRLVPGSWAATAMSYGFDNRTTALRVLTVSDTTSAEATRLETRIPGADANPYLVLAASIAAGLEGVASQLPLGKSAVTGNAYDQSSLPPLPRSLREAVSTMRAAQREASDLLGEVFVAHYLRTREWELGRFEAAVTDWERERYLEII